jgi:hypothetical protein
MEDLAQLRELAPADARKRLLSLAREKGTAALETLQAALGEPALAEAALDALAEVPVQEAWDLLEHSAQSGPAGRRKGARRAQHRLRSRGFRPAPIAPRQKAAPTVEQARASSFDMAGAQFLRLVRSATLGMVRYASFIVGPEGLLECHYALANRSDVESAIASEDGTMGADLVEMGLAYLARRARQAAERSRAGGKALPRDWPEAAWLLEDAPEDSPPAELAVAAAQAAPLVPGEATRLVQHRTLARWIWEPERLAPYARDWLHLLQYQPARTEEGLPNLSTLQARGQMTARIVADLCDAATMRRLAEQLAEQSRMLFALGERDLAGLALRCATGLEEHPGADDPFLRTLVEESMGIAVQLLQKQEEEAASGPWVPAGDAANPLWVPRPAEPERKEDAEEKPASRLWLPGQQ